jgi:hypothetical protein
MYLANIEQYQRLGDPRVTWLVFRRDHGHVKRCAIGLSAFDTGTENNID